MNARRFAARIGKKLTVSPTESCGMRLGKFCASLGDVAILRDGEWMLEGGYGNTEQAAENDLASKLRISGKVLVNGRRVVEVSR